MIQYFIRKPRKKRFFSSSLSRFISQRLSELGGASFIIGGLLLLVALFTYNPLDPSLNTAIEGRASNLLNAFGSYTADFVFQTLGLASFLLVLVFLSWGCRMMIHTPPSWLGLRILALIPILVTLASGMALLPSWVMTSIQPKGGAIAEIIKTHFPLHTFLRKNFTYLYAPEIFYGTVGALLFGLLMDVRWRHLKGTFLKVLRAIRWGGGFFSKRLLFWEKENPAPNRFRKRGEATSRASRRPLQKEEPVFTPPSVGVKQPSSSLKNSAFLSTELVSKAEEEEVKASLASSQNSLGDLSLPSLSLLQSPKEGAVAAASEEQLTEKAHLLKGVLEEFGVRGKIVQIRPGPVVTLYELEPAAGTKSSRVIGLADDIARSMSAVSARVAVVPGRNVIGIELPNESREVVYLRQLLLHPSYDKTNSNLALALGKDIGGAPIIADLSRMPHLLVAGTTGSGKSVAINTMILSLLYRLPPEKCRFIMIDPKMLELSVYDGIPHLLSPVVTDPKKAVIALKWTVREMESRYRAMSKLGVRNIESYNLKLLEARAQGEQLTRKVQTGFDPETGKPVFENQSLDLVPLPFIVVVVDEMADLMLVAGKEIESAVQRLAQMARAAGIHLIMATQRPSVDVITGTIKANFPSRISFQVTSKIDSRTILGEQGAEQLLGHGDMLYLTPGGRITRVHGPFVRDEDVEKVVSFLKAQSTPTYIEEIVEDTDEEDAASLEVSSEGDALYDQALEIVCRERKASTSFIQRHLQIGYNRAARIIDRMETEGVISAANHVGKREVLARAIPR